MKKLILKKYGNKHPITFEMGEYAINGNLYVGMITHAEGFPEPWSSLTVNLGVECRGNCAYIDTNNNGSEIIHWLLHHKLGNLTGNTRRSGFCVYPEFEFDMEKITKYVMR